MNRVRTESARGLRLSRRSHADAGMHAHCIAAVVRQRQSRNGRCDIGERVISTRRRRLRYCEADVQDLSSVAAEGGPLGQ
jgi:hypothetical protein